MPEFDYDRLNAPATSLQDIMEREYPPAVAQPCNDCPWRRVATPGWLGPDTPEGWIESAHSEAVIACHKTLNRDGWAPGVHQCRGAAIFRENVMKTPRNPTVALGPEDTETVFANNKEFLEHHRG
jgi:hypothetical protein